MAERCRYDRLKGLERTFTMIILLGCLVSLYLSTISSPASTRLTVMGTGYIVRASKGETRNGVFGQIFGSHRHRNIFQENNRMSYKGSELQERLFSRSSEASLTTIATDDTDQWFRPLSAKSRELSWKHEVHPHFRDFIISSKSVCKDQRVDILVYVHSATRNFQRRRILRETWANKFIFKNITMRTVFMLGRTHDFMEQMKIKNENLVYGDIVQGDFLDTHQNLTVKAIMVTRWIAEYCAHARYVIKADDDIFVNIFLFVEKITSTMSSRPKTIACHLKKNGSTPIVRDQRSQWYVSKELLPGKRTYPQFCPGYALMFTGDLAPIMYTASFTSTYIPIDDVYMFGLLLEKEKDITFINVQSNFTLNQKLALDEYTGNKPITHVASNAWESGAMEKFWFSALERLSPWALKHSSYATLEKRIHLLNASIV
ncbi:beta-1,3-galactosyltransferase 1-like [Liolophura sinensis]|uniref:beta-1,3-galactosyltransferase 1-like n=1 Tax=Liolophura sinensis TaxID=3198878 RepID=UPI0031595354